MFDILVLSISIWNKLDKKLTIRIGDHLVIYPKKERPETNDMKEM